jgi:putative redox protein
LSKIRSVEVVRDGAMHFAATTGTGRSLAYDDVTTGGHSPVESVLAALGACTGMDVASIALKKRQNVSRYANHLRGEQRTEYPQVFTRIDVLHEVEGPGISEQAIRRCIELSALKYCPVNAMLSAGATEVHHRYLVRSTGPTPFEAEAEVLVTGPYKRPDLVDAVVEAS